MMMVMGGGPGVVCRGSRQTHNHQAHQNPSHPHPSPNHPKPPQTPQTPGVEEHVKLLKTVFDFPAIQALLARKDFSFVYDSMHGVQGPYAKVT